MNYSFHLFAGDVGIIVEHYPVIDFYPEDYEVEFFTANGDTLTVVSVPETKLRTGTGNDVFHVRGKLKSSYNHA